MTLDLAFLHRVYRTSAALTLFGAVLIWGHKGPGSARGWLLGSVLSLSALAVFEWSIRRYVRPGAYSAGRVLAISFGKMFILMLALGLAFLAARRGWLSLLWVLPGFALPHAVILLKVAGSRVLVAAGTRGKEKDGRRGTEGGGVRKEEG